MYPSRFDIDELDCPRALNCQCGNLTPTTGCSSELLLGQCKTAAPAQLRAAHAKQTFGFRVEKLADILEAYRGDCSRNDNVRGMQRAAQRILTLLAASTPA